MKSNTSFRYSLWTLALPAILFCLISARPISMQEKYIEQFKDIAISEMHRTGIPASIKLAQGLLESQSGKSELAVYANNHFGIKCKNDWSGDSYYYHDDDKNEVGEIIASCFRSYSTAMDSYRDHSDFLVNRSRYKDLFSLSKTDYTAWAQGLKKCGYATDPNYSDRLIKTIQKYNLDNLDFSEQVAETKEIAPVDTSFERRIEKPYEPIIPAQISITIAKSIPVEFISIPDNSSKQKHKRKRRN